MVNDKTIINEVINTDYYWSKSYNDILYKSTYLDTGNNGYSVFGSKNIGRAILIDHNGNILVDSKNLAEFFEASKESLNNIYNWITLSNEESESETFTYNNEEALW